MWSRAESVGRLRAVLIVLVLAALGGCGFTPLYATPGVTPGLSSIEVNVPHGRTAYLLSEALNDALGRDRSAPAAYRLDVTLIEKRYPRGLRQDNTANLYEAHVIVNYQLTEIDNGKVLTTGSEPVEVSYAATPEPYAGITAQQDAQQRAADEAAQRIRLTLATYFASHAAP
jgi:LPS-assembly lipoprotein